MDAVAYRTRARCRETAPQPVPQNHCAKPCLRTQNITSPRRRLRKSAVSDSQHEELNNNNSPATAGDNDHDDSVASNEIKIHGSDSQKKAVGLFKRKRCVLSSPSSSSTSEDSDVVIVGEVQSKDRDAVASELAKVVEVLAPGPKGKVKVCPSEDPSDDHLGDDEELRIVGIVGQVVTRDLPHPRPDCAEYRFNKTSSAAVSNSKCCTQCYCYVCDVKASECKFWGTGRRERDHANARPHPAWNALRQAARTGDRSRVQLEFTDNGPLRTPLRSHPLPTTMTPTTPASLFGADFLQHVMQQLQHHMPQPPQQHLQHDSSSQHHRHQGGSGRGARGDADGSVGPQDIDSDGETFLAAIARLGAGTATTNGGYAHWSRSGATTAAVERQSGSRQPSDGRRGQQHQGQGQSGAGTAPLTPAGNTGNFADSLALRQHPSQPGPIASSAVPAPHRPMALSARSLQCGGPPRSMPTEVVSQLNTTAAAAAATDTASLAKTATPRGQKPVNNTMDSAAAGGGASGGRGSGGGASGGRGSGGGAQPPNLSYPSSCSYQDQLPTVQPLPISHPVLPLLQQQHSMAAPSLGVFPPPQGHMLLTTQHQQHQLYMQQQQQQPAHVELLQPLTFQPYDPYRPWMPSGSKLGFGFGFGTQQQCQQQQQSEFGPGQGQGLATPVASTVAAASMAPSLAEIGLRQPYWDQTVSTSMYDASRGLLRLYPL